MNRDRVLWLIGGGAAVILAILAALTVLFGPISFLGKVVLVILLVVPALVVEHRPRAAFIGLGVLAVILILLINGIFGDTLDFAFNPDRIDPAKLVVCRESASCVTVHAFLFSAIFLFVYITGFAYTTLLERKFIAYFQNRVGPNRVGPDGFLQPLADAIKLITKEDIMPAGAYKLVWFLAPMLKAIPALVVVAVVPFGPDIIVPWFDGKFYQIPMGLADPNVGVLWVLAVTSVATYGVALAGWASNNKYAMLGGLRAAAQMVSYELSLGVAMVVPIMLAGSMSVGDIIEAQGTVPVLGWFVFQNPLAAGILLVALVAEVNRAPFDLPEAEQELTAGFMTEYSGMKFAMFMMAEYLGMIAVSVVAAAMFFGGYHFILVDELPLLGPLVMIGKIVIFLIGFVWVRATLPRIRYDRLMTFGWKVMLPLSLVSVCWTAISVVLGEVFSQQVHYVLSGVLFVLVMGGTLLFLRRLGQVDEGDDLADDPLISGKQRGIGYTVMLIFGGLMAGMFALAGGIARVFGRTRGRSREQGTDTPRKASVK